MALSVSSSILALLDSSSLLVVYPRETLEQITSKIMVGISPRDRGTIADTASILPDSTAKGARPGQEVPKATDKEGAVAKQFAGKCASWASINRGGHMDIRS